MRTTRYLIHHPPNRTAGIDNACARDSKQARVLTHHDMYVERTTSNVVPFRGLGVVVLARNHQDARGMTKNDKVALISGSERQNVPSLISPPKKKNRIVWPALMPSASSFTAPQKTRTIKLGHDFICVKCGSARAFVVWCEWA